MLLLLEQMKQDRDCVEVEQEVYGRTQRRVQARRGPEMSVFSEDERQITSKAIEEFWEDCANEASDLSPGFIGWKAAAPNEIIPYEIVFVGDPAMPPTEGEIEFCRQFECEV